MKNKIILMLIFGFLGFMQINCQKISTVGARGSYLTPGSTQDVLDHSYDLARNCTGYVEGTAGQNPEAYVHCHVDQESIDVEYDPDPAPKPETQNGWIINSSLNRVYVRVISYRNNQRIIHHAFYLETGQRKKIDLMPGLYLVQANAGPHYLDLRMNVDNEHNDSRWGSQTTDFYQEIPRF